MKVFLRWAKILGSESTSDSWFSSVLPRTETNLLILLRDWERNTWFRSREMRGPLSFHVPTAGHKMPRLHHNDHDWHFFHAYIFRAEKAGTCLDSGLNSSACYPVTWAIYLNFRCLCCVIAWKWEILIGPTHRILSLPILFFGPYFTQDIVSVPECQSSVIFPTRATAIPSLRGKVLQQSCQRPKENRRRS